MLCLQKTEIATSEHVIRNGCWTIFLTTNALLCLDWIQDEYALKLSWPFLIFYLVYWGPLLDTLSFAICGLGSISHFLSHFSVWEWLMFLLWFVGLISTHHLSIPLDLSDILSLPLGISVAPSLLGVKTIYGDNDDDDDNDNDSSSANQSEAISSLSSYRNALFSHEVMFERPPWLNAGHSWANLVLWKWWILVFIFKTNARFSHGHVGNRIVATYEKDTRKECCFVFYAEYKTVLTMLEQKL